MLISKENRNTNGNTCFFFFCKLMLIDAHFYCWFINVNICHSFINIHICICSSGCVLFWRCTSACYYCSNICIYIYVSYGVNNLLFGWAHFSSKNHNSFIRKCLLSKVIVYVCVLWCGNIFRNYLYRTMRVQSDGNCWEILVKKYYSNR